MTSSLAVLDRLVLPHYMRGLPRDRRGYPVPAFVHWIDGKPDFRVIKPGWVTDCHRRGLCWLCGQPRGRMLAFVIGPMCAINRTSSELPSHLDCARFAVQACPFLSLPHMHRQAHNMPAEAQPPAGIHLERNPGAAGIWICRGYDPFRAGEGWLFRMGEPSSVTWFAEGRLAMPAEVLESVRTGLPSLIAVAQAEAGGIEALRGCIRTALRYFPFPAEALRLDEFGLGEHFGKPGAS